jgi:uncharacterized membrane protein
MKKPEARTLSTKSKNFVIRYFDKFSFLGLVFAVLFFLISMLPSLLPRPWLYQGLISGLSMAVGYGLGILLSKFVRWLIEKEVSKKIKSTLWKILIVAGPISMLIFLYFGANWQNQVRQLVGEQPLDARHTFRILFLTIIIFVILISLARLIRKFNSFLNSYLSKFLPKKLGILLGVGLVVFLSVLLVKGVLVDTFVSQSNKIYSAKNDTTPEGVNQPTSFYRSGSPESYAKWETLGYQGKNFVARGPSQQQLRDFTKTNTKEQIRIYSGVNSAPTPKERANLAVAELKRTDAFSRKVIVIATVTGTGWLEPQSTDSIEYMYGGDTAIVGQQYSYLPSWISFLVDQQNATDAGQELFNAVYKEWSQLPVDKRPKLLVYGLSLGSFGGQSAFTTAGNITSLVDGALFMGTPSSTVLWQNITQNRDKGSPEWQPIYEQGKSVRFAASTNDIQKDQNKWQFPRILYMQHASDPVVWFNFNLLLSEPDWLKEPRGPDVSSKMHWYPFVTFFQVTVDQFFGVTVPNGHGHNYPNTIVDSWAAISPPDNWNEQQALQLQSIINTYSNE